MTLYLYACKNTDDNIVCNRLKNFVEFDFDRAKRIGPFTGIDYFGDGSFYLIDAPGHSQGHICGLVRTTSNPDTFILLGADACHHNGEFRPSEYRPLPEICCSGFHAYLGSIGRNAQTPFFSIPQDAQSKGSTHDLEAALETVHKVQDMDGYDNLLVLMAHDASILGHVEFFPKPLNDWHQRDLAEKGRWNFLQDFRAVLPQAEQEQYSKA